MNRDELIKIMDENLEGKCHDDVHSIKFDIQSLKPLETRPDRCKVTVVSKDTTEAALELTNPLILNFASEKRPGGGCWNGAKGQEEFLFYHSRLDTALKENMYPLKPTQAIIANKVPFIRGKDLKPIETRYMGVLTMAAIRGPELREGKYSPHDRDLMRAKVEAIFKVGAMVYPELVLGAWGCGAFRNPPEEVAALFKEAIDKYGGYFKQIVFAITGDIPVCFQKLANE